MTTTAKTKPGTLKSVTGNGTHLDLDGIKSYATFDGLQKALIKFGFENDQHLVVKTLDDRYTAIFSIQNFQNGGYIGLYSQHGFMTT